jgi:hypothetical protein
MLRIMKILQPDTFRSIKLLISRLLVVNVYIKYLEFPINQFQNMGIRLLLYFHNIF